MTAKIVFLPGDGIGPEVTDAAKAVLSVVAKRYALDIKSQQHDFGGVAIDHHGHPFPEETEKACVAANAVFLGAVGGPKWQSCEMRPEQGLLALRKTLHTFANLRPTSVFEGLDNLSPLRPERVNGTDLLIVRELTGGLYFGAKVEGTHSASDVCAYTREEVERVAHVAFEAAAARRSKVTSVDKANVLASSRLWRAVVGDVAESYPQIELEHVLVDAMAMKLIEWPAQFDVVLTENLFGDILSDEASVIAGSIGLAPSASIGSRHGGLYEPIHGSAPDITGQGKANPVGAILSVAMLLRYGLRQLDAAERIDAAVKNALNDGFGTADIGRNNSTQQTTDAICDRLN